MSTDMATKPWVLMVPAVICPLLSKCVPWGEDWQSLPSTSPVLPALDDVCDAAKTRMPVQATPRPAARARLSRSRSTGTAWCTPSSRTASTLATPSRAWRSGAGTLPSPRPQPWLPLTMPRPSVRITSSTTATHGALPVLLDAPLLRRTNDSTWPGCAAGSTGTTFTTVIEPFSQRIAQKVAAGGKVAGCTPGSVSPATSVSTSSVSGRRLMVSSCPDGVSVADLRHGAGWALCCTKRSNRAAGFRSARSLAGSQVGCI